MKSCPFCGSVEVKTHAEYQGDTLWLAWAYCDKCGARGPELPLRHLSREEMAAAAMGAWGVRAEETR